MYGKKWSGQGYDNKNNIVYELIKGEGYLKEYYKDNILIFEGEYLNGEKNWKGKEYDYFGRLIYEGEFLNGKRNGKCKEYENNNLIFEGEYKNGYKKIGKEYFYEFINSSKNLFLEFEGEYLLGKKYDGIGYDKTGFFYIH